MDERGKFEAEAILNPLFRSDDFKRRTDGSYQYRLLEYQWVGYQSGLRAGREEMMNMVERLLKEFHYVTVDENGNDNGCHPVYLEAATAIKQDKET